MTTMRSAAAKEIGEQDSPQAEPEEEKEIEEETTISQATMMAITPQLDHAIAVTLGAVDAEDSYRKGIQGLGVANIRDFLVLEPTDFGDVSWASSADQTVTVKIIDS